MTSLEKLALESAGQALRQAKMCDAIRAIALPRTVAGHEPSHASLSRPCRVTINYRKENDRG